MSDLYADNVRLIILSMLCLGCISCGIQPQPESAKTVAAYEVPLTTNSDRKEFLALLSREAKPFGLQVDASSKQELDAVALPGEETTIHAGVWRGEDDDEFIANVMDFEKPGLAWLSFSQGKNPALNSRFRKQAMAKIITRWPNTLSLPIMPNGAIPLPRDLQKTKDGYVIKPSAAPTYRIGN